MKTSATFKSVYMPSFPGFYNTIFGIDDHQIEWDMMGTFVEAGITDDSAWDFFSLTDYQNSVGAACTETLQEQLQAVFGDIITLSFSSIWSPTYYNFHNDQLLVDVQISDMGDFKQRLGKWVAAHRDYLAERIAADFTSRDGFISFMPDNFKDFMKEMEFGDTGWCYLLGYIIDFAFRGSSVSLIEEMYYNSEPCPESYFYLPGAEGQQEGAA